jgi:hypothetical protein
MKKLLIALFVSIPVVGCTQEIVKKAPAADTAAAPAEQPAADPAPAADPVPDPAAPTSSSTLPEDRCLDGQDMDAADVDLKTCPALPDAPDSAMMGKETIDLGAWEIGTTADGDTYKYGFFTGTNPRKLKFDTGTVAVNDKNIECWAKGYYRLRKMLQTPPAAYVALHKAHFQYRFFQFQTDMRNGATGFKEISSFQDHLVKWVTVITAAGVCQQPTMKQFRAYAQDELKTRGLPVPTEP